MSNIFGFRTRGEILKENKELLEDNVVLREQEANHDVELRNLKIEHLGDLNRQEASYIIKLSNKDNEIAVLKANFKDNLAREVASEKRNLKVVAERQDKEHRDRMKKLEAEYAAKIAKCDRDLEADKASYRKYLRSEHNTKLENLEKENSKLSGQVAELTGENTALENMNGILEGQVDSTVELMQGLIKALPTVTASLTTPDISAPNVTVGSGNKS